MQKFGATPQGPEGGNLHLAGIPVVQTTQIDDYTAVMLSHPQWWRRVLGSPKHVRAVRPLHPGRRPTNTGTSPKNVLRSRFRVQRPSNAD